MRTRAVLALLTLAVSLLAGAGHALASSAAARPSGEEQNEALRSAVAAAVVGALSERFGDRAVSVTLETVDVRAVGILERLVGGRGHVRIDGDSDWVGFGYRTLYDAGIGSAAYPAIELGSDDDRILPNDAALVQQLDDHVVARLRQETGNAEVRLQLDRIDTREAGVRFLRIEARGLADFGRDGTVPAQVQALYDRRGDAWISIDHALDPTAASGRAETLAFGP